LLATQTANASRVQIARISHLGMRAGQVDISDHRHRGVLWSSADGAVPYRSPGSHLGRCTHPGLWTSVSLALRVIVSPDTPAMALYGT